MPCGRRPYLDSSWTPAATFLAGRGCKCLRNLVDLVRFELTTSSMPFKKYQSLAGISTRNKRLSTRPRGLRWTPRGTFWASGLRADSRNPHRGLAGGVLSCARGCGLLQLLSAEEDNNRFPYKAMPMWSGDRHRDCDVSCGLPVREWSNLLQKSIRWLSGRRRKMSPPPVREDD